ncbi:MAG: UDP-N-acetylglucosamine 1-carboxyvinyltransferase [Clostridia bacterium]
MDRFIIYGGRKLNGEIEVNTAKNCVLVLMAASILTDEKVLIKDCPKIKDVDNMQHILEHLGCKVIWQGRTLIIDSANADKYEIPSMYAREIRSSIFMLGSILGRHRKAKAVFPGGCDIGLRPIDLHINGLRTLNVKVIDDKGYIDCDGRNMKGGRVVLDFPSVGATENLMLASVLIDGETIIENAAKEPEVSALQLMLNKMGGRIKGAGTSTIRIEGVRKLRGVTINAIADRIVAGTYMIAAAITGGELKINKCDVRHLGAIINKMDGYSCDIRVESNSSIVVKGYNDIKAVKKVSTGSFPAFPTDLQAPMSALLSVSNGISIVTENVFETRFRHIPELIKLGADITVKDRTAVITGVKRLCGACVTACELRGGAALVIAGLNAEGVTVVEDIRHIDRGYENLDKALNNVGAMIIRQ